MFINFWPFKCHFDSDVTIQQRDLSLPSRSVCGVSPRVPEDVNDPDKWEKLHSNNLCLLSLMVPAATLMIESHSQIPEYWWWSWWLIPTHQPSIDIFQPRNKTQHQTSFFFPGISSFLLWTDLTSDLRYTHPPDSVPITWIGISADVDVDPRPELC